MLLIIIFIRANDRLSLWKTILMIVDDKAEKITMYIPVADPTLGLSPSCIKTGLRTRPDPIPRAPEANPDKKPMITSLMTWSRVHYKSPGTN
jgi:hypothetical protein